MKTQMRLNMMTTLSWILVACPVFAETNYNFQFQKSPASAAESQLSSTPPVSAETLPPATPAAQSPTPSTSPSAVMNTTAISTPAVEKTNRNTSVSIGFGRFYADDSAYANDGGEYSGYSLGASYMATPYIGVAGNIIFGRAKTNQYYYDESTGSSSSSLETIERNVYTMGMIYKPFPNLEYVDFGLTAGMLSYSEGASKDLYYVGGKFGFKLNPMATASFDMARPIGKPGKDKSTYAFTVAWNF
jgi:hypothetical protein